MGLVSSFRGKQGGYNLSKAPKEITLGEVIRSIGGALLPKVDSAKKKEYVFADIWDEVEKAMAKVLDKVTFEDICEKSIKREKVILYEI